MKVVAFDGSKEPRGPVGRRVALVVERLQAAGVDAEVVRIERVKGTGCYMCGRCGHRLGDISCSSPPEDGLRRCARKIKAADAVLIGTPVYGTHSSPTTQELLIRLEHDRRERGDTRLAGTPVAVVVGPPGSGVGVVTAEVRRHLEAHGASVVAVAEAGAPDQDAGEAADALVRALVAALSAQVA